MTTLPAAPIDPKNLLCCDCGGWPIDNGAVFVAVFCIKDGKPELGGMCELCWLKRLERRGRIVNETSTPDSQLNIPQMELKRDTYNEYQRKLRKWGLR